MSQPEINDKTRVIIGRKKNYIINYNDTEENDTDVKIDDQEKRKITQASLSA